MYIYVCVCNIEYISKNYYMEEKFMICNMGILHLTYYQTRRPMSQSDIVLSKKGDTDQESIQSSTTPDPGYHMEN